MHPPARILVIDPNSTRQASLLRTVDRLGHLGSAEPSVTARLAKRGRPLPEVCLFNIQAWQEGGVEFLSHCIEKDSPCRIIVFGNERAVGRGPQLLEEGVQIVLLEPLSPTELEVTVQELLLGPPAVLPSDPSEGTDGAEGAEDVGSEEGENEASPARSASPIREQIRELAEKMRKGEAEVSNISPVGIQLQSLCVQDKPSIPQIVTKVSQDPNLAAAVLRASNSAAYRGMPRILDLNHAGVRLGVRRLGEVAQMAAMRGAYSSIDRGWSRLLGNMWKATVQAAYAARLLGERLGDANPGALYSMALLHNLGEVLVVDLARKYSGSPPSGGLADGVLKRDMDRHHGPLGAMLLKSWGFAPGVCSIAFAHHEPSTLPQGTPVARHSWLVGAAHAAVVANGCAYKSGHDLGPHMSLAAAALGLEEALFTRSATEAQTWWDTVGSSV